MKIYPVYLTTTGTYYRESESIRPGGFPDYQFILTVEGEGRLEFDDHTEILKPGSLIFIPPNIPHNHFKVGERWVTHWLTFNAEQPNDLLSSILPDAPDVVNLEIGDITYSKMLEVNRFTSENYQKNALGISSIIYSMIVDFIQNSEKRDSQTDKKLSYVDSAILFMEKNYSRDLSLEEISAEVTISTQYLCRVFKKQLGLRPFEYLKQLRINKSKTLLLEKPEMKIEDIAAEVGFNNPSYYGSIFKQYEGMTPKEFLKIHKQ